MLFRALTAFVSLLYASLPTMTHGATQEVCLAVLAPSRITTLENTTIDLEGIFRPDWDGGPALIPAVRLAVDRINNRSDVLAGFRLRLLEGNSGCNVESQVSLSVVKTILDHREKCPVVGIIGPACSEAASFIGKLAAMPGFSLLQISPATSPHLIRDEFSNTFRILSSSIAYVAMFVELMKSKRWNESDVAFLYDANRVYFKSTFMQFQKVTGKIGFVSHVSNNTLPLNEIKSRHKIIFLSVGAYLARKILCFAFHFNPPLIRPVYQWIFHDKTRDQFLRTVTFKYRQTKYTCSKKDMEIATDGVILATFNLNRSDADFLTDVDLTYRQYLEIYKGYLKEYLMEKNLSDSSDCYNQNGKLYSTKYYDATWAMAFSLNQSLTDLKALENTTLSSYGYNQTNATAIIKSRLSNLHFEGISGRIAFMNSTRDTTTIVNIVQLNSDNATGECKLGNYNNGTLHLESCGWFASGSFKRIIISVNPVVSIIFLLLSGILLIFTATLHILYIYYHQTKSIKASNFRLSHLIFSGCYILLLRSFLLVLVESKWINSITDLHLQRIVLGIHCNVGVWCISLGNLLIFGTMSAQLWRLYHIFHRFQAKSIFLSDTYLLVPVVIIIFVNMIVYVIWVVNDPLLSTFVEEDVDFSDSSQPVIPIRVYCDSEYSFIYITFLWGMYLIVCLFVAVISTLNRHISKDYFNTTVSVNMVIYFGIGLCIPCATLSFMEKGVFNSVYYAYVMSLISIFPVVFLVSAFIFLPKIWTNIRTNYAFMFIRHQ